MELIKRSGNGDQLAFAQIVERYQDQVARTVIGMLGKTAEADDVGQECFIRFYRSMDKYRGEASLGTYLTRIAINLCLNELKKGKRTGSLDEGDGMDRAARIEEPGDDFDRSDKQELINMALGKLDAGYRAVVVLRLVEGYSTKETAKMLKLPQGTVLSRLSRAQKNLRKILEPYIK